jgi:hypothetical protein
MLGDSQFFFRGPLILIFKQAFNNHPNSWIFILKDIHLVLKLHLSKTHWFSNRLIFMNKRTTSFQLDYQNNVVWMQDLCKKEESLNYYTIFHVWDVGIGFSFSFLEKLHNLPPYKRKNCTLCKYARGVKENYVMFFYY